MATRLIEIGSIDIEAIKDQHPLASIVEPYVSLRRKSGLLEGLCPFHDERSPSFKIYEKDQRYHCFGCGAHGDAFDFLEHMEGLDLRGAAERITGGRFPTYSPERIEELRAKRAAFEAQEAAERAKVIEACRNRWDAAVEADIHPYLVAKGIQPHGTRREADGALLTPIIGRDGQIQCVQAIHPDGRKQFPKGGTVTGGFFVMGGKVATTDKPVILCEGFATGATVQEATGNVVICAYNGSNMVSVASFFATRYAHKEFLVAGDNDHGKKDNPGLKRANEAAAILKCAAVVPAWPEGAPGTDFNDMAAEYGIEAVRALIVDGEVPAGTVKPKPDIFETLSLDELEALPPPTYLVDGILPEHGLTFIYGDPGAGKSFIALDMALRIAYGMDWHGTPTKRVGVLYIAGEGRHGLGKRVKGWRKEHALEGVDAPFKLLPVAVHMLDADSVDKLNRTIDVIAEELGFEIGLTIVDTVSRSIPGHDENKQDTMSLFVDGMAKVHDHTDGAAIGVHHSGKDRDKGMRGSTVLLGACEASMRVTKDGQTVTLSMEKQKDDEEADPIYMQMKKIEWAEGLGKPLSTLVPGKSEKPLIEQKTLSRADAERIFDEIDRAWSLGNPWSVTPNSRSRGRYLADWIVERFEVSHAVADQHVVAWQQREYMVMEIYSRDTRAKGLKILKRLEQDQ